MKTRQAMITIKGLQNDLAGEDNKIEFITDGTFGFENGSGFFSYMESELTGMEGTKTTFNLSPNYITMVREGTLNSQMVFQEGRKHNFLYETPFGSTTMGVDTKYINMELDERGGDVEIDYLVDMQQQVVAHNKFEINVSEQKG